MQVTQDFVDEVRRAIRKLDGIRGGGALHINNSPHGLAFSPVRQEQPIYDDGGGGGLVLVQVGTNIAAGKYNGTLYTSGALNESGTGSLTLPDGFAQADSNSACILLVPEEDSSNHDGNGDAPAAAQRLAHNSWALATAFGNASDENQTPVFAFQCGVGDMASADAKTMNPSSATTADTTTWSRNGDGKPLSVWMTTRVTWDGTGGQLLMYQREFSFDARGMLFRVGGEVQVNIDDPTSCT